MKNTIKTAFAVMAFFFAAECAFGAVSFTEAFNADAFEDTANTSADWNTVSGRAGLKRGDVFGRTVNVINWGGGIIAIDYDPASAKWLIGGYNGRLNEYDGFSFRDHSINLSSNWGTSIIYAIKSNGPYWLVGGGGHRLNKWDGYNTWTDMSSAMSGGWDVLAIGVKKNAGAKYWLIGGTGPTLYRFDGENPIAGFDMSAALMTAGFSSDVLSMAFSTKSNSWFIGGKNGMLAKYDGYSFIDLSAALDFKTNDVNSIDWMDNGSPDGIYLIGGGSEKLSTYQNGVFTDHSSDAGLDFSTIWTVKWNGSYWLLGGFSGVNTRIQAYNGGSSYHTYGTLPYFDTDPVWAIGSDLGGNSGLNLFGGKNSKLNSSTGAWNAPVNAEYTGFLKDYGVSNITCAEYNGIYWLIGGASGALNRYDGTACTDLRQGLEAADPSWKNVNIQSAGWNGSYWLIGGTGGLLARYDGNVFSSATAALNSGTAWGTNSINVIEYADSEWLLGGAGKKLASSPDGSNFTPLVIPAADWGNSSDAVLCADWAGGVYGSWFIGGAGGRLEIYRPAGPAWSAASSAVIAGHDVNAVKWDKASSVRLACRDGILAEYKTGVFTNLSSFLQNFGTANIHGLDYNPTMKIWMYGGSTGKVNISDASLSTEAFTDYSYSAASPPPGMIENFGTNAVNAVTYNGSYWIIAGENGRVNRYGQGFISPGWAYSTVIDQWFAGYTCATLTASALLNGQQIDYWLSANNGATWLPAPLGSLVCFSGADNGDRLKWRARLATFDGSISPLIETLFINFGRIDASTYTVTPTSTITKTGTVTKTGTPTGTATVTPTFSRTVTATPTFSGTGTPTLTYTPTMTWTVTKTWTPTMTITVTFTATATPSETLTISSTATTTSTSTITGTSSITVTETFTVTDSMTVTMTQTGTQTKTASATISVTSTGTGTITLPITATFTRTAAKTGTMNETATVTPALDPAFTATATAGTGPAMPESGGFILYPNPVNDRINVSYSMSGPGKASIRIYNEAGRLVVFLDERKPAGRQVSSQNTLKLAPGVYFCLAGLSYDTVGRENSGVMKFIVMH